jgi:hypothetical protein
MNQRRNQEYILLGERKLLTNYTVRRMVLGYNGRTDWSDRADPNGFFRGCVCLESAKRFLRNDKKNPFQSARSAQSVLPSYPKTIVREV